MYIGDLFEAKFAGRNSGSRLNENLFDRIFRDAQVNPQRFLKPEIQRLSRQLRERQMLMVVLHPNGNPQDMKHMVGALSANLK